MFITSSCPILLCSSQHDSNYWNIYPSPSSAHNILQYKIFITLCLNFRFSRIYCFWILSPRYSLQNLRPFENKTNVPRSIIYLITKPVIFISLFYINLLNNSVIYFFSILWEKYKIIGIYIISYVSNLY